MTTKRIITIIGILLAILFLVLGGIWLVGRNEAKKAGTTPLTFRQFLGISTTAKPGSTVGGTGSSVFTVPGSGSNANSGSNGTGGSATDQGSSTTQDNVQSGLFTDNGLSPADSSSIGDNGQFGNTGSGIDGSGSLGSGTFNGSGSISLGNGVTSGTGSGGSTGGTAGGTGTAIGLTGCTAADTSITFTPAEITKLNALQSQYNYISSTLAGTSQVATELSTYTSLKLEEAKVAELQAFCSTYTPLLANPDLKRHVPTPFWHDATQDVDVFSTPTPTDPQNPLIRVFLERILRINVW